MDRARGRTLDFLAQTPRVGYIGKKTCLGGLPIVGSVRIRPSRRSPTTTERVLAAASCGLGYGCCCLGRPARGQWAMRRRVLRWNRTVWPADATGQTSCLRAGLGASQQHWGPGASFGFSTCWTLHCGCLVTCMVLDQLFTSSLWTFLDIARCSAHRGRVLQQCNPRRRLEYIPRPQSLQGVARIAWL